MDQASETSELSFEAATKLIGEVREKISLSIFGQKELIEETMCCLLSGGHILMTGAPGLAKTTLVRVFSKHLGLNFGRVQYTPDLLPSDILGAEVLNIDTETGKRSFEFMKGPIFVNLLLADEINRASPRTQSAMLEAMQERQVTVAGSVYTLPAPFMVFATQNPLESEGTFPLPEAQLDRFLISTLVDYPDLDAELAILAAHSADSLVGEKRHIESSKPTMSESQLNSVIQAVKQISVSESLLKVINDFVRSSRPTDPSCDPDLGKRLWYGAGVRAGISLISTGKALALMYGDKELRWKHIKRLAKPVMRHRICLNPGEDDKFKNEDEVIDWLIEKMESKNRQLLEGA